jgi:hypothetical protein
MGIATYKIDGIRGHVEVLLRWLWATPRQCDPTSDHAQVMIDCDLPRPTEAS